MNVENAVTPTPDQIKEMSEPGHDRPIYMVNLLKFKEKAEYEDGRETEMTGQEAYSLYGAEVVAHLAKVGGPATQPPPESHVQATLSIPENAA